MTPLEMVREFHVAFGHPVAPPATSAKIEYSPLLQLRHDLLREEWLECKEAMWEGDVIGIADALADMQYVINGAALALGIDLDAVFAEVHKNNMSKLGPDGKPILRADGKILKCPGWTPPDIAGVLGIEAK